MRKLAFPFHSSGAQARRDKWWAFPPAPCPTAGYAQPAGSDGAEQCSANSRPRPKKGVTLVRRCAAQGCMVTVPPEPTFGSDS